MKAGTVASDLGEVFGRDNVSQGEISMDNDNLGVVDIFGHDVGASEFYDITGVKAYGIDMYGDGSTSITFRLDDVRL